jgi:hypothetical protein
LPSRSACTLTLAAKNNAVGVADKRTVNITGPILVGGTLLLQATTPSPTK